MADVGQAFAYISAVLQGTSFQQLHFTGFAAACLLLVGLTHGRAQCDLFSVETGVASNRCLL